MSELIGVFLAGALFAGFGLMRRKVRERQDSCGTCTNRDGQSACHACALQGGEPGVR